jgi:hypothetical protein
MNITGFSPEKTPRYSVVAIKGGVLEAVTSIKGSIPVFLSSTMQ